MKQFRIFLILVCLILSGAGCAPQLTNDEEVKPKVAATIFPLYDIVRTIGGDAVDTTLILPAGASPHTYEPTPSVIKQLQGSSLIFQIGHGLDHWTSSITASIPALQTVTVDTNINLRAATDTDEPESDQFDPHYWMNPMNASIIVDSVAKKLSALVPEHTEDFVLRAEKFKTELKDKDAEWKKELSQITNKNIVTFHDAFMYFADHFGLTVVATFEPFPGKEPTPQYLIELKREIDANHITHMYLEPQFAADSLESFARDNGITLGILDPEGSQERTGYIDMMDYNVKTIVANQQ